MKFYFSNEVSQKSVCLVKSETSEQVQFLKNNKNDRKKLLPFG